MDLLKLLALTFLLLLFLSCEEDNQEIQNLVQCEFENPLMDLDWLKEINCNLSKRAVPYGYQIFSYQYRGSTVFLIDPCYNCRDSSASVFDCEGNGICEFGGIMGQNTCPDFSTEATHKTLLAGNDAP